MPKSPEKMREVKERLFQAALELFAEKGYENTSVAEITQKAKVSKGTFFTHFPTKGSVFGAVGKILVDYMAEEVESGLKAGLSTYEILRQNVRVMAAWCEENQTFLRQILASGMHNPSMSSSATPNRVQMGIVLAGLLARGQEIGDVSREVAVEDVVVVMKGAFFMVMHDWLDRNGEWSLEEKMHQGLALIFRGIRP